MSGIKTKQGWLKKKSNKLGWDKRYFKRVEAFLAYSKSEAPFEIVGRIPLNSVICVEKSEDRDYEFNVVERSR